MAIPMTRSARLAKSSPIKKRPAGKNRKKTKRVTRIDGKRLFLYFIFFVLLAFSILAAGYVIFFRTVVAGELPVSATDSIENEGPETLIQPEEGQQIVVYDRIALIDKESPLEKKNGLPKVAIIIDDMGYDEAIGMELLHFPIEVSYSFLPFAPQTRKLERLFHRAGKTVFLHLPLEPKDTKTYNVGPGAIYLKDSPELQREKLAMCLAEVPHAVGVNTHMGSAFTEDREAMTNILHEIKNRSLLYVDSITTPKSVGLQTARAEIIKSTGRSVFLDNVLDETKICNQLEQLVILSERRGMAIGIGHPHRQTLDAITQCGRKYVERVRYVGVREMLQ